LSLNEEMEIKLSSLSAGCSLFQAIAAVNWKEERPRDVCALGTFNRMWIYLQNKDDLFICLSAHPSVFVCLPSVYLPLSDWAFKLNRSQGSVGSLLAIAWWDQTSYLSALLWGSEYTEETLKAVTHTLARSAVRGKIPCCWGSSVHTTVGFRSWMKSLCIVCLGGDMRRK
jgi:hypothetical protein